MYDFLSSSENMLFEHLLNLKNHFLKTIIGYFSEGESQLLFAMVFGGSGELDASLKHSFKVIGLQHVLSASGYNIGLVLGTARLIQSRFSRFYQVIFSSSLVATYVLLANATPSVLRAGLMAVILLIGQSVVGRIVKAWWVLAVTMAILLIRDFSYLTSISFQLSCAATMGLIFFLDSSEIETAPQWWDGVVASFKTTLAAQAFTVPLVVYHFGELSGLSIVANVALVWLTPILTVGVLVFSLLAQLGPVVAAPAALLLHLPLFLFVQGAQWLSQFDGLFWQGLSLSFSDLCLCWGVVVALKWWLVQRASQKNASKASLPDWRLYHDT